MKVLPGKRDLLGTAYVLAHLAQCRGCTTELSGFAAGAVSAGYSLNAVYAGVPMV
jgi:hypothetical protein